MESELDGVVSYRKFSISKVSVACRLYQIPKYLFWEVFSGLKKPKLEVFLGRNDGLTISNGLIHNEWKKMKENQKPDT